MNLKFRLLLLLIIFKQVAAQNDQAAVFNQKITIEAQNEPIRTILKRIEKQTQLGFSFDSKTIDSKKKRTVSCKNKTVPEIISVLFDDKIKCKVKGNNIILYKDKAPAPVVPVYPAFPKTNHVVRKIIPSKPSRISVDTSFLYYIDLIVPGFSGKDSVVRTDSIKVPSTHYLQIKDDTTILLIKKGSLPPK
jgi:hypothetical protein